MATELSNNLITLYDPIVKQLYQAKGFATAGSVRTKSGEGKTFKFPVFGKLTAEERVIGSKVVFQNAQQSQAELTVKNWTVVSPTDMFEQTQVNYDDLNEHAMAQAMACGRRSDQLIIDALEAATISKQIAVGTTGLTVAKIASAGYELDKDGVPMEDRYFVAHVRGKQDLLGEEKATSSDYMNIKALVRGEIDTFYGFKFIWLPDMVEGGLPKSSTTRYNYAYHKQAVGYGQSMEVKSRRDWSVDYQSDVISTAFAANACVIDATGVVEVLTKE